MSPDGSGCVFSTYSVTSCLFVGATPTHLSGLFVNATTAHHALRLIDLGASAVVPTFEVAAEVLRLAGRSEEGIAFAIAVATGQVQWDGTF